MPTKNKTISGRIPTSLFEKFSAWEKAEGFTSRSQALVFLIERFSEQGGFSGVSLADRVKALEEKIDKLMMQQQSDAQLENQVPKTLRKLKQTELAKRLKKSASTLCKQRKKKQDKFYEWSKELDPDNLGWKYSEEDNRYSPFS